MLLDTNVRPSQSFLNTSTFTYTFMQTFLPQTKTTGHDHLLMPTRAQKATEKIVKTHKDSSTSHSGQHQSKVRKEHVKIMTLHILHCFFFLSTRTKIFSCPAELTF